MNGSEWILSLELNPKQLSVQVLRSISLLCIISVLKISAAYGSAISEDRPDVIELQNTVFL
ncbi:hypothetical protein HI914_04575 [Erysiphe necator]|nr:hypothetical protein HI914_04575 [Erysiphe necator]